MLPLVQRLVAIFESVAVIVLFCMAVLRMDRNYFAPLISQRPLSLALALLSVQFAVIAGEFVLSMTILVFKTVRKRRSEAAQSRIAPLLLAWLDGGFVSESSTPYLEVGQAPRIASVSSSRPVGPRQRSP